MQTGKAENTKEKGSSSDFAKAMLLLASIPATLIAAVVFDEHGGHILGGYFALIFALVAFGALRKFVVSLFVESMTVEGVVVSLTSSTKFVEKEGSLSREAKTHYSPVFQFYYLGREYRIASLISRDSFFQKLFGPKVGDKVSIWVPVNNPQEAEQNNFRGRYLHLLVGVGMSALSFCIVHLLTQ
ncbi:DUF3592 domain-containing protein [Enterovibrio calviensis]|uniref:DUF3592 domain-containing protein n=1 Tax=Enterovibrio calviensis TaxID=91359 RepID=UPI000484A98B|nr:DUF3592 domain-containing protein [Enterovibrio calviensis]